jgi:hypothetical protein
MNRNHLLLVILVAVVVILGAYWALANDTSQTPIETDQAISTSTDNSPTVTSQMPVVTSGENPQPGSIHDMPVEPAAASARKDLATRLGIAEKSIVIMLIEDATWNDSCLGLGGPAESCLQAVVPGFRVEMLAQGKTYIYRTNKTGTIVRAETK